MKKPVLLLALVLSIFSLKANAQDTSWGFMGGVNNSTVNSYVNNNIFKPGLNLGLFINSSRNAKSGLKTQFLYSQLGSEFEGTDNKLKLQYFQIPVMGVLYLNDRSNKFRPKILIGPYLGVKLSGIGGVSKANQYNTPNFNFLDLGGKAEVGFNYKLGERMWLNTEIFFAQGFTDVFKEESIKMINQSYGINLGVSFPLK